MVSRGRASLPCTRLRIRNLIRSRRSSLVLIRIIRPLRAGLADLLLQLLPGVAHALLLVRIGLAHPADVGGDLPDHLAIGAGDRDVRLLLDRDVDPVGDVEHDRMRVAEREVDLLALQLGAVADADDVELLLEALGDAVDGVGHQAARQAVELLQLGVIALELGDQVAVLLRKHDAGRQLLQQLALRALHFDRVGGDLDGHALRDRDRLLTNSGHDVSPHVTENFAADAGPAGGAAGHHPARRRQDAGAEAAEHGRHFLDADVDAASGTADALDAADDLLAARAVLQEDADHLAGLASGLLRRLLDQAEALDVALVLEDPRDLGLQLARGHVDTGVLGGHRIAETRQHVGYRIGHISCPYQELLVTPVTSPSSAALRKQSRHIANLRM